MRELISARLRRRAAAAGGEPLLTYYEPVAGVRVELSAVTMLNWVDKTCHLLGDELGVGTGDTVQLALAQTAPGHWVTAVWELACWQVGAAVALAAQPEPALVVTGPDWSWHAASPVEVLACTLHPLGLPFPDPLPPPVLDYALEVRGQPDVYPARRHPEELLAWSDDERRLSQGDLVAGPALAPVRALVRPDLPWSTAHGAVITPLLTGGSAVVVAGPASEDELSRIRREERADG